MALVESFKLGNTSIKIYDDAYRDNTPEQNEAAIKHMLDTASRLYLDTLRRKAEREARENEL